MKKGFEEQFSHLQSDMVSICLENVENRADAVYIYAYFHQGRTFCNYFYRIHGKLVKKHQLNTALSAGEKPYDVSIGRQKMVLQILNDDLLQIQKVCESHEHPMPEELKIVCTIHPKTPNPYRLKASYAYEKKQDGKTGPGDWAEEWFASLSV